MKISATQTISFDILGSYHLPVVVNDSGLMKNSDNFKDRVDSWQRNT